MISKTTKVVNNKFQVTFNFTPKDITHSRKNSKGTCTVTHKGGNGTTSRQGIWEGIEVVETRTKIGSGAWRSHGTNKTVTVEATDNNVTIQAEAKYRLKTMGHHWNDKTGVYPFFWFGNVGGKEYYYNHGSYRDRYPKAPDSQHNVCIVPSDWKYINCQWSDWAYKHALATPNWDFPNGKYEQRNGKYETAKETNGWISDAERKQMYRKSIMFNFEKSYTSSVSSSGIATDPSAPVLTVHPAKGDNGQVTVKYVDSANQPGKILLKAYCNGNQADIFTYTNSDTFKNNESRTYTVDFNLTFGERYRGNDIHYEAWAKNNLGFECKNTSGKKGVHRYNGRPSIPQNLSVSGSKQNSTIYDYVNFSWNKSTDPDNDSLTYDVWLKITDSNGKVIKDSLAGSKISNTFLNDYNIKTASDNSNMEVKVRAYDGLLYSEWSSTVYFEKGAVPTGSLALLAPRKSGTLYNEQPRFCFSGYDGKSTFVFVYKNNEYTTKEHKDMFTADGDKIIFKPNFKMERDKAFECHGYMKNEYGNSKKSSIYKFTIKKAFENINEGNLISANEINQIQTLVADFGLAYNKNFSYSPASKDNVITASIFNECRNFLNSTNDMINRIISNNIFDYTFKSNEVSIGDINDDKLWDNLVLELGNI